MKYEIREGSVTIPLSEFNRLNEEATALNKSGKILDKLYNLTR